MSKTYEVTFYVTGPEGAGDTVTPYDFDPVFEALGLEIIGLDVKEVVE
jgi:hypothetical protein